MPCKYITIKIERVSITKKHTVSNSNPYDILFQADNCHMNTRKES